MHYDARRFQTSLLKEIEATTRRVLWPQPADKQVDKIGNNPHDFWPQVVKWKYGQNPQEITS